MNPDTTPTPRTDAVIQSPNSFYMVRVENICRELERELAEKTNEVARLREQLTRVIEIAEKFRWYTKTYEWLSMKDELDKIKAEHESRLTPAPEEPTKN